MKFLVYIWQVSNCFFDQNAIAILFQKCHSGKNVHISFQNGKKIGIQFQTNESGDCEALIIIVTS